MIENDINNKTICDYKALLAPTVVLQTMNKDIDIMQALPKELIESNKFVCRTKDKQPINAKTGYRAVITNEKNLTNLEQALNACKIYSICVGVGVVLGATNNKNLVGLDFDDVIDKNGNIAKEVKEIIKKLDTYTELSPSGRGLHCLFYATKMGTACKNTHHSFCKAIEMYDKDRYFTITGKRLNNKNIEYRQTECDEIYEKYIKRQQVTENKLVNTNIINTQIFDGKSDEEYLQIGLEKDKKLKQYYDGIRQSSDESSNDMGFLSKLAYWCNNNEDIITKYFFNSRYFETKDDEHKEKAKRSDYLKRTLDNITVDNVKEHHFDFFENKKKYNLNNKNTNEKNEVQKILDKLKQSKNPPYKDERTDLGTSTRFADTTRDVLRFNADRNNWMFYNGKQWINDTGDCIVNQYAKYFKKALYLYAIDENNFLKIDESSRDEYMDNYQDFVHTYGAKRKRDVMIKDASSVYPILNKDLDKNKYLFNLYNGTLNLSNNELQPHKASDFISKIANVSYNKSADATKFKKFLNEIMFDNQAKIAFILRIFGLSLTTDTKEEKFFIFHGSTTRNGKSTLVETITNLLGDYAISINPETLAVKRFSDSRSANGDVARLDGARLVLAPEPPENMILNVSDIKTFTGQDTITARNPYERHFQFKPVFKLIMNTNHLPKVNDSTLFKSNRVYVVTFDRHFEENKQDKSLKGKLTESEELSGILNLLLEGLQDYHMSGLNPPPEVILATAEYEKNSNMIKNFIDECFVKSSNDTMTFNTAYSAYKRWCDSLKLPPEPLQTFTRKIRENVLVATKNGNRNTIIDYKLRYEGMPEESSEKYGIE